MIRKTMPILIAGLVMATTLDAAAAPRGSGWGAGNSRDEISGRVGGTTPGRGGGGSARPCRPPRCRPRGGGGSTPTAAEALRTVKLPPPEIVTNPVGASAVGMEVRYWARVTPRFTQELEAGGISIFLEARPSRIVWDFGNGETGSAPPGQEPEPHSWSPSSGAGNVYEYPGEYRVTATVEWDVHWSASTGGSGEIPDRASESSITYTAIEFRSILNGG